MYTLNKSYINTKKIKHLQCKNAHQWLTFTGAYTLVNHNQCQANMLNRFAFFVLVLWCFSPTINVLKQKHGENLRERRKNVDLIEGGLGNRRAHVTAVVEIQPNSNKLTFTS